MCVYICIYKIRAFEFIIRFVIGKELSKYIFDYCIRIEREGKNRQKFSDEMFASRNGEEIVGQSAILAGALL